MEYILNDYVAGALNGRHAPSPVPVAALGLDAFRIEAPHKIAAVLKQLLGGSVMVTLSTPQGITYVTMLWALDPARDLLSLAADAAHPRALELDRAGQLTAFAQLDSINIRFQLNGVKLVRGSTGSVFNAPLPRELYRFQRRAHARVAPAGIGLASARLQHPHVTDSPVVLRVLDLSPRGVALALPHHMPALSGGTRLDGVQLDLDPRSRVLAALQVHHVGALRPQTRGWRLGCELVSMSDSSVPMLRNYLESTRGRTGIALV